MYRPTKLSSCTPKNLSCSMRRHTQIAAKQEAATRNTNHCLQGRSRRRRNQANGRQLDVFQVGSHERLMNFRSINCRPGHGLPRMFISTDGIGLLVARNDVNARNVFVLWVMMCKSDASISLYCSPRYVSCPFKKSDCTRTNACHPIYSRVLRHVNQDNDRSKQNLEKHYETLAEGKLTDTDRGRTFMLSSANLTRAVLIVSCLSASAHYVIRFSRIRSSTRSSVLSNHKSRVQLTRRCIKNDNPLRFSYVC